MAISRATLPDGVTTLTLVPFAVVSGVTLSLAFMPANLWPLAFVAVAVFGATVVRARQLSAAIWLGTLFGLGLLVPSILWQAMITTISYVALVALETVFYALLGGLLWVARGRVWTPWLSAGLWVAVEALFSYWPFNGFGWLRLGYTQIDSPLAGLLPFAGVALASFAVALIGQLAAQAWDQRAKPSILVVAAVSIGVLVLGSLGTRWQPDQQPLGDVNVGFVQGGAAGGGLYGLGEARSISFRHAEELERLMIRVAEGSELEPAIIVLPENTTDMDPLTDETTGQLVHRMAERAGVPLLIGVPISLGDGERKTSSLWWTVDGPAGEYQKRNLVPFGEWVPFRDVFEPLVPQLAYVGDQSIPGTAPGVINGSTANGKMLGVGTAICYDVAYPATVADVARAGAEIIVVQSNNAMFGRSAQVAQQFAITRARAAELRREILVVTTSGQSGLIGTRGEAVYLAPSDVSASGVVTMPRRLALTPFVQGGWLFDPVLAGVSVLWLILAESRRRLSDGEEWTQAAPAASTPTK